MASLKFLTPNIVQTCQRFPLSIICCLVMFTFSVFEGNFFQELSFLARFCLCGFFVFAIARLAAEARGWNAPKEGLFGIVGTLVFYVILDSYGSMTSYLYILGVFATALSVTPFLGRKADDFSYWDYQQKLAGGVFLAIVSSIIFVGGILIALISMKYLFEIKISNEVYKYVWWFALFVYGPFNMLSWLPRKFEIHPSECHAGPGLPFILNWILAPLAFFYFLILYAYGAKILIEWELPRGMIVYMVSGFGALGILIYIAGWIMRDTGSKLLQYLYKHFFSLLILPVVLLFVAIFIRIDQYGLTQDRYMVVLLGAWMGGVALLYTFKPAAPLRIILGSLMVLLFVASFGPWGGISLSDRSQMERLKHVLSRNQMLVNNIAVPASVPVSFQDESQISSIMEYFSQNKRGRVLAKIMPELEVNKRNGFMLHKALEKLNLKYVSRFDRRRVELNPDVNAEKPYTRRLFSSNERRKGTVNVRGYDFYVQNIFLQKSENSEGQDLVKAYALQDELEGYSLALKENKVYLVGADGAEKLLLSDEDVKTLKELSNSEREQNPQSYVVEKKIGSLSIKMVVKGAEFWDFGNGDISFRRMNGELFLSK